MPPYKLPICEELWRERIGSYGGGFVLVKSFGAAITLANFLTRLVMIALTKCIRCASVSREARFIRDSVFIMSFFNTGLLYVFASVSTRISRFAFVRETLEGVYPDFNAHWYQDIGQIIVSTTIFNFCFLPVEWAGFAAIRAAKRCLDRGCRRDRYATGSKTIQAYVDLHKGPIFNAHYKYAFMLGVTYVAMLFGAGQPALFPLACLGMIVQYTTERLVMAYSYVQPPMFDSRINRGTIQRISWAPVLYAFSAAWVFSNQQVFRNTVTVNKGGHLYSAADHLFEQYFYQLTPGTPFVVFFFSLLVFILVPR